MAKIALAVAGAVIGGLLALPTGGMSVFAGMQLGMAIGGLAGMFLPGPNTRVVGPRVNDLRVMASTYGAAVPWGQGTVRAAGNLIQTGGIIEHAKTSHSGGYGSMSGAPSQTSTTYTYTCTFCLAFAEGPVQQLLRMMADGKLIYDKSGASASGKIPNLGSWSDDHTYAVNDTVLYQGNYWISQRGNNNNRTPGSSWIDPSHTLPFWLLWSNDPLNGIPQNYATGQFIKTNLVVNIHYGNETDVADSALEALVGVGNQPAYRGLFNVVFVNLDLTDFGNRVPQISAEFTFTGADIQVGDIFPAWPLGGSYEDFWCTYDPTQALMLVIVFDGVGPFPNSGMLIDTLQWTVRSYGRIPTVNAFDFTSPGNTIDRFGNPIIQINYDGSVNVPGFGFISGSYIVTLDPVSWAVRRITRRSDSEPLWQITNNTTYRPGAKQYWFAINQSNAATEGGAICMQWQISDSHGSTMIMLDKMDVMGDAGNQPFLYGPMYVTPSGEFWMSGFGGPFGGPAPNHITHKQSDGNKHLYQITLPDGAGIKGMLFDDSDNTLIVFDDYGQISGSSYTGNVYKINPQTGAVIASAIGVAPLNIQDWVWTNLLSCGIDTDGTFIAFYIPPGHVGNESHYLARYKASDLSIVKVYDIMAFFPKPIGFGDIAPQDLFYDPLTGYCYMATGSTGGSMRFPLDRVNPTAISLDSVVSKLFQKAALITAPDYDVTALAALSCRGIIVGQSSSIRQSLDPLMRAYFFDVIESDMILKCIVRGGTGLFTIPQDDLVIVDEKSMSRLNTTIADEKDLPVRCNILYQDPTAGYQQNEQHDVRNSSSLVPGLGVGPMQPMQMDLPLTLEAPEAKAIAQVTLYGQYAENAQHDLKLTQKWLLLEPADPGFLLWTPAGKTKQLIMRIRLLKDEIGADITKAMSACSEDQSIYTPNVSSAYQGSSSGGGPAVTIGGGGPTYIYLYDTPLMRDQDANDTASGAYIAVTGPSPLWGGAVIYKSLDDALFDEVTSQTNQAQTGLVLNALPAPHSPFAWDDVSTLHVQMAIGITLAAGSDFDLLTNGVNAAIVGAMEVIQFGRVVNNGDGTYTLSHLLRGRQGTDYTCGQHVALEQILLLNPITVLRAPLPLAAVQKTNYLKAVTLGAPLTAGTEADLTPLVGRDLMPWAPWPILGSFDPSTHDITITWFRRTRYGGFWSNGGDGSVPLNETSELYDVEIYTLDGVTLLRTFTGVTTPSQVYTSAQQVTDFGSNQVKVNVKVYQRSGQAVLINAGRGFPGQRILVH